MCTAFFRNRVVAAASPRITADNALYAEPSSPEKPMEPERLDGILRTGRRVAAGRRRKRRYGHLVKANQQYEWRCYYVPRFQ